MTSAWGMRFRDLVLELKMAQAPKFLTVSLVLGVAGFALLPGTFAAADTVRTSVSASDADPVGVLVTRTTTTQLTDGLSGTLINSTISNPPIPDSPDARKDYGGPDSASGRATAPQPCPAEAPAPTPAPIKPASAPRTGPLAPGPNA